MYKVDVHPILDIPKGKEVEFTYITIDDVDEIQNWNYLMRRNEIQWRSLATESNTNNIRSKYLVSSIPKNILVNPQGNW